MRSALLVWFLAAYVDGWMAAMPGVRHAARCKDTSSSCVRLRATGPAGGRWQVPASIGEIADKKGQRRRKQQQQQQQEQQSQQQYQHAQQVNPAAHVVSEKHAPQVVSEKHALEFEREGHTLLRGLVSGDALSRLTEAVQSEYDHRAAEAYSAKLTELGVGFHALSRSSSLPATLSEACEKRGLPVPTLQVYNLHRSFVQCF